MSANKCAWCLAERGEAPQAGESHGVCERHAAALVAEAKALASEFEQWKERVDRPRSWWSNPSKRREAVEFSIGVVAAAVLLACAFVAMILL